MRNWVFFWGGEGGIDLFIIFWGDVLPLYWAGHPCWRLKNIQRKASFPQIIRGQSLSESVQVFELRCILSGCPPTRLGKVYQVRCSIGATVSAENNPPERKYTMRAINNCPAHPNL